MKNKLLYFGLLVVTLYLAILYDSPMLLGFSLMEVLLPVVSGILMLWTAAHMKAQIYLPIGVAEKEQPVNAGVRIENKSRIPVSRLETKIKIQNRFYQPEKEVIFQGMADGRGTTRLTTAITSSQCGPVALWVEQAKVWDLFHLFGKKIRTDGKEELSVLPEYYAALIEIAPQIREQLIDSEQTGALGALLKYAVEKLIDGKRTLPEIVELLCNKLEKEGLSFLSEGYTSCGYAVPRRQEIYACFNRYRRP